ncbi:MAG: hypothetical protein K2N74_04530 [Clostridiales bacterium]|nr:hypothetical protein [Clostridiales bacterium]
MKKKLIDFDGMFDARLAEYMSEHPDKYSEKQWEAQIPKLYAKFGDTYLKCAENTPRGYYAAMTNEELVDSLARHIQEDVPVSDFLCRELESRDCPDELAELLKGGDERILTLAANLAGANPKAFDAYFAIILGQFDADIKDTAAEQLKSGADEAKERALAFYEAGKEREYMLEILSRVKERDERVFEILFKEFRLAEEEIPMRASYLAAYGDERALPVLLEAIDRDSVNYLEYRELKYAIEALGGEYTRERDFSDDAYYKEICEQSQLPVDPELLAKKDA